MWPGQAGARLWPEAQGLGGTRSKGRDLWGPAGCRNVDHGSQSGGTGETGQGFHTFCGVGQRCREARLLWASSSQPGSVPMALGQEACLGNKQRGGPGTNQCHSCQLATPESLVSPTQGPSPESLIPPCLLLQMTQTNGLTCRFWGADLRGLFSRASSPIFREVTKTPGMDPARSGQAVRDSMGSPITHPHAVRVSLESPIPHASRGSLGGYPKTLAK